MSTGPVPAPAPARARGRRWLWIGGAVVVVAGVVTAVVVLRQPEAPLRGELTATLAAQRLVTAVNAGDGDAAAQLSCANFANAARSAATAGADPGIDFTLGRVHIDGPNSATAQLDQRLHVDGTTQHHTYLVQLDRTDGRWVACGES